MNIYNRLTNFFGRGKESPPPEEKVEEKIIDYSMALPGVSDGRLYYTFINGLNKAYSTNYVINRCTNILAYNLLKKDLIVS